MTIGAHLNGSWVEVFFRDNGDGIAPENLSRILEPLFTTKARGMGLGLAITKAIVEKNRSKLEVKSNVGEGSEFSILIPVESAKQYTDS